MLREDNFNQSDLQRIHSIPSSFKVTVLFFVVLCVPASFLFGLLGLAKTGHGYWPTTLTLLAVFGALVILVTVKDYLLYRMDKTTQKKFAGTITVTGKSTKRGNTIISTDSPELKKLDLLTSELFDKVSIGDQLTIEISKFSKTLLLLYKEQTDLFNSH